MTSHWKECRGRIIEYADSLINAILSGTLNETAFEGLVESYLEQPAFSNHNRHTLMEWAQYRLETRMVQVAAATSPVGARQK